MNAPLYNLELLRLAASACGWPRLADADASVERRSPTCGSCIVVDVETDAEGRVAAFGHDVRACALGQASAALLAEHIIGKNAAELRAARDALGDFLRRARGDPGEWPGLMALAPARDYPARHPSILLAFDAAAQATDKAAR